MYAATARLMRTALAALACATPGVSALERVEGIARSIGDGTELYREIHTRDEHRHRIEYHAPDGTLIVDKTLDYTCSDSAPAFEQRDLRSGTRIGARWEGGEYLLERDGKSRRIAGQEILVASSGFDRFVRAHWDTLAAGQALEFEFALPARLQTLRLHIARRAAEAPGDASLQLRVTPALTLLRAFVDPIDLAYDAERRLQLYRGMSNITGARGETLAVEIRYSYRPEQMQTAPSADEPRLTAGRTPETSQCAAHRT